MEKREPRRPGGLPRCRLDLEAIAEQVFSALADPIRRAILATLAAQGPATATDLADRLPITRQAIAETPGPFGRRRVW